MRIMGPTQVRRVLDTLEELYPDAGPELDFQNRYQLLVATILSAQCTDQRVNTVTEVLFRAYPTVEELAGGDLNEIIEIIRPCGLFETKGANIQGAARLIVERHGGEVPGTMEALTALPGVGRKTANVVLSNGFGVPAIAVDTHVFRVTNRIGLVTADTVERTETQLMEAIPKKRWSKSHHLFIFHGRRVCKARKPECERCPLSAQCRYRKEQAAEAKLPGKKSRG